MPNLSLAPWCTDCVTPSAPNSLAPASASARLMKLLGHESMTTSQRYVTAAGTETRSAAAQNPLCALIPPTAKNQSHET